MYIAMKTRTGRKLISAVNQPTMYLICLSRFVWKKQEDFVQCEIFVPHVKVSE